MFFQVCLLSTVKQCVAFELLIYLFPVFCVEMSGKGFLPEIKGYATTAIHAGQDSEQWDSWQVISD